uniref:C2H2-type domain-containing protein n=1 Tax=Anopheles epiroticus TaxID=199890 RepID=A0A182PB37_9DIPT
NYGLIQRYASGFECKHEKCQYENLHEHFHCHDTFCRGKVLYKKYEIIRHLKWHKKRKESLKYGFYRFSSSDDCSIQYGACQHNHKHTHYHCVHENCDKVYISTSDVQMHANYHRKHEAIVKNGFQRFRATEDCNTEYCAFRTQRTTHFHCRRENCKYTFKNKADMEKHKTYHLKDEMLLKDGYKKFLKTEDCTYKDCRFSRVCNHIHCMHENCHYVLHSSGQLLSHKRKHERMDTEVDYRRYQMARNLLSKFNQSKAEDGVRAGTEEQLTPAVPERSPAREEVTRISPEPTARSQEGVVKNPFLDLLSVMAEITFRTLPLQMMYQMRLQMLQQMSYEQVFAQENLEMLRNLTMMGNIEEAYLHQIYGGVMGVAAPVDLALSQLQTVASLGHDKPPPAKRKYKPQEATEHLELPPDVPMYIKKEALSSTPPRSKLLSNPTVDYRLLKKDDPPSAQPAVSSNGKASSAMEMAAGVDRDRALLETANFLQFSSSKTLFNRKRGRPRKNHVMEVYNNVQDSPQAIFTSFKLEKSDTRATSAAEVQAHGASGTAGVETERNGGLEGSRTHPPAGGVAPKNHPQQFGNSGSNYGAVAHLSGLDSSIFGNFSQLLERHMREATHEPSLMQNTELNPPEKARNHLKCVVCQKLFETFADIKNHECRGDRAALDKPLLAFPPPPHTGQPSLDYRSPPGFHGPELSEGWASSSRIPGVSALLVPPAAPPSRDTVSLVKTAGTFFPDVNANKLKYA